MKQKDDATLSLFSDELPASDLPNADASSKKFESCTVPMIFFVLSGKLSFYNRYGFRNKVFEDYVKS
jgi:hypothetical protein